MGTESIVLLATVLAAYLYKNGHLSGLLGLFKRPVPSVPATPNAEPAAPSAVGLDSYDSVTLGYALARAIARESKHDRDVAAIKEAVDQFKAAYLGTEAPKGDAGA